MNVCAESRKLAKETYNMPKETYQMTKETWKSPQKITVNVCADSRKLVQLSLFGILLGRIRDIILVY